MNARAFTSLSDLPLHPTLDDVARFYNKSTAWVVRRIRAKRLPVMPEDRMSPREPYEWKKHKLEAFYKQQDTNNLRFFGSARRKQAS